MIRRPPRPDVDITTPAEQLAGLIRHIITFVGGFLVARGKLTLEDVDTMAGIAVSIVGLVWSFKSKGYLNRRRRKVVKEVVKQAVTEAAEEHELVVKEVVKEAVQEAKPTTDGL